MFSDRGRPEPRRTGSAVEFGVTNVEFLTYTRFGINDYLRLL